MFAFTHIPKTAGTTLNYILQKNFGSFLHAIIQRKGARYNYDDLKQDKFIYKNAKCISGHVLKPFIDYKEYNDKLKWFTFLRDPIKRYVSQYIHQQTNSNPQYNLPIQEWGEKFSRSNWQVKWIAGEEDLEAAKQIIREKFIFIGITEKFDESLVMMKNCFDINIDISYEKSKMVVRDDKLKKELLKNKFDELLPFYKEQNSLDIQLYNYVERSIFKKQNKLLNKTEVIPEFHNNYQGRINLISYKLKRNFIYRPFVKLKK